MYHLILLATILLGFPTTAAAQEPSRLAVIKQAPAFSLVDQNGKEKSLADYKGKVLLVSFIFTTCSGSCPATTHKMGLVQQELARRGMLKSGDIQLLSISLDPERDTPEKLRGYMQLYDADAAGWTFLTGPPDTVHAANEAWGMWTKPAPNGQLDHPSRIFLVDPQLRIREIYNLAFLRPEWVVEDMQLLLKE